MLNVLNSNPALKGNVAVAAGPGGVGIVEQFDITFTGALTGRSATVTFNPVGTGCSRPITTNDALRTWYGKFGIGLDYLLRRKGPMAIGINQGGLFARALPTSSRPDVQFHVATLSSDMAGSKVHEFSGFTMSVCQQRPEARGFVRIASNDPLSLPVMQANYLSSEHDRATLIAGLRLARKLASTRALTTFVAGEYRPGSEVSTDEGLLEFAKNTAGTIFHPSGTTKMGPMSDPYAVVDSMLGEKAADMILRTAS